MGERLVLRDIANLEKTAQVVLFLLDQMGPLTEVHITYLLYQIDFGHMEKYRTSVTGGHYYKEFEPDNKEYPLYELVRSADGVPDHRENDPRPRIRTTGG